MTKKHNNPNSKNGKQNNSAKDKQINRAAPKAKAVKVNLKSHSKTTKKEGNKKNDGGGTDGRL